MTAVNLLYEFLNEKWLSFLFQKSSKKKHFFSVTYHIHYVFVADPCYLYLLHIYIEIIHPH